MVFLSALVPKSTKLCGCQSSPTLWIPVVMEWHAHRPAAYPASPWHDLGRAVGRTKEKLKNQPMDTGCNNRQVWGNCWCVPLFWHLLLRLVWWASCHQSWEWSEGGRWRCLWAGMPPELESAPPSGLWKGDLYMKRKFCSFFLDVCLMSVCMLATVVMLCECTWRPSLAVWSRLPACRTWWRSSAQYSLLHRNRLSQGL